MSQGDELKLQRGAATNTEGEQGNVGVKNRDHAHDSVAAAQKSLGYNKARAQGPGTEIPTDYFLQDIRD